MGTLTVFGQESGPVEIMPLGMSWSSFWIFLPVVLLIATAAVTFLVLMIRAYSRASLRINRLNAVVAVMEKSDDPHRRQYALDKAQEDGPLKDDVAQQWKDFDSTLVESADGRRLHSTEPAEEYFNSETLAPELLHGRLLSFLPTSMTALGVLGTFLGLTIGLGGLDLGAGSDTSALRSGVTDLISGASLAFLTSIIGVVASLTTNFVYNLCARIITKSVRKLQESADRDLHRQAGDYSLVKIAQISDEQNVALQALDEKLGVKFQEAVAGMSSDMEAAVTKALQNAIAPAMAELSNSANNQSSLVMENLVGRLATSFEDLGEQQASKISGASTQLDAALNGMSTQLESLVATVQDSIDQSLEGTSQQTNRMAAQVEALSASLAIQQEKTEQTVRQLSELVDTAGQSMNASAGNLRNSTASLENVATSFAGATTSLGEHLEATGHTLASSRNQLDAVGTTLSSTNDVLREQRKKMEELYQLMASTSDSLTEAAVLSKEAFGELEQHQEKFLGSVGERFTELTTAMSNRISAVQEDMHTWLDEYSKTVSNQTTLRMSEWNKHTEAYSTTMVEVAGELREVVEGISDRNGQKNAS